MDTIEQKPLTTPERVDLARKCFREYYAQCFWFLREDLEITEEDLTTVAKGLRLHGGHRGFRLAAKICP